MTDASSAGIVFLTPNLPPVMCGLADHSMLLGRALRDLGFGVSLIGLRGEPGTAQQNGWPGAAFSWNGSPRNLHRVVRSLSPAWLWVQLSPYGYARLGVPWRLGKALAALKRECREVRIAVCVHETHCEPRQLGAKGPVLSMLQRRTVAQVVRLADVVFTVIPAWETRCILEYNIPAAHVHQLPIAANIPAVRLSVEERSEVRRQLGIDVRDRVAVAFGLWPSQRMALERLGHAVEGALRTRELGRVIAIGGESQDPPLDIARFFQALTWRDSLVVLGPQPPQRVSELVAISDIGLVPTPVKLWPKSGAARAFEQAGLTLWIADEGKVEVVRPSTNVPTWEEIAQDAVRHLRHHASKTGLHSLSCL